MTEAPQRREQRRLVTVVFADVVGSTALAEELDPEDVRAILSRYYAIAGEVVTAHGGIVAKLLGDGVLACFGIPSAHGDDALRALDAALVIRERVARDDATSRLRLRVGVNTGEVLANEDASGEIVGDAVNTAARVAAAAGEGEILAADATHRSAPQLGYGEPREIAAKGKSQPVRVWPVAGGREDRVASTPFVGREDDLAQLELVARRAFRDRRPHLVTLVAPPGTGKSRLADELRSRLGSDVWYARAHCPPYGEMLAYGPLREVLAELVGLSPDAPAEDVRRQIGAVVDATTPRVAQLVAASVAPESESEAQDRDEVVTAWRTLVARLAADRPLLIVFEDLQNASDSLLDLVEALAYQGTRAAILLVCLARPELLRRRASWGGGKTNALNLSLEPLGNEHIALLVARLLESEPPPALRDHIVDRAAGNPFFAEELVRSLLERGPIDLADPDAVSTAMRALPETVQATLLARIDMLAPEDRNVLQSAAVIGRVFDPAVLAGVLEVPADAIDAALDRLAERDLLIADGDGQSFRNALVREVAYGMLPRSRRAREHARVARHFEETSGDRADELAGSIGTHYLEATRLRRASAVPIDLGMDPEQVRAGAVHWLTRAGRANASAGAFIEALQLSQEAASVATDDEKVEVLTSFAEIASGGDTGWDATVEAIRLWRAKPDRDPLIGARAIVAQLRMLFRSGVSVSPERLPEVAATERLADEALGLALQSKDELMLGAALTMHATFERTRPSRTPDSLNNAREEAQQAASILEREGSWYLWSIALDAWAAIVGDQGDFKGAYEVAARRLTRADQLVPFERAHINWTIPLYALPLGDVQRALRHIEVAISEPSFVRADWGETLIAGLLFLMSWRAAIHWALGDWDGAIADARSEISQTIPRAPEGPMRALYRDAGCAALYVARRRERPDLVAEFSPLLRRWCDDERSLALLDDEPSRLDVAVERVESAGIDLWQTERAFSLLAAYGRVPVGVERLDALVAWTEARGLRPLLAQVLRLRARARGSRDDAKRAHELLTACGMKADAALAAVELASLGDRAHLEAARAELERIGDRVGLAAADKLV